MRKRFEQQLNFGTVPIGESVINLVTRHELPPVLYALQYAFNDAEMSEEIFALLEEKILKGKEKTGRNGMSLWEILVLGSTKLCLGINFDFLHDLANSHKELRGVLGVATTDFSLGKQYHYQTIKDNVQLLDEQTIKEINVIIVKGAHGIIKKKEGLGFLQLCIKSDSFVVESHIHFPTDMNLLWDSSRKCVDVIIKIKEEVEELRGWGHCRTWYGRVRKKYRICAEIHRKKGANYKERLEGAAEDYLEVTDNLVKKLDPVLLEGIAKMVTGTGSAKLSQLLSELSYYLKMLKKHQDLLRRRVLEGEKIPHGEKVFSIFEPHVEWNSKGKPNKAVELGHNVLVATDQYQFVLYHEVYEQQVDKSRTIAIGKGIAANFCQPDYGLSSISFDRNFFSLPAKKELNKLYDQVVLPKPGKKSQAQQAEESTEMFQQKRQAHSAVEANISQLGNHGLGLCRDKGIGGFKRYVAYGILSYNLHRMGDLLMAAEREKQKKAA